MQMTLRLIPADERDTEASVLNVLELPNDADPRETALDGVDRIDLQFPTFSDGRAFSQAFVLRVRMDFKGDIRATGAVLIDQLVQMQRTGFSSAVLRKDQDLAHAQRQFERYASFYQGDTQQRQPHFTGRN